MTIQWELVIFTLLTCTGAGIFAFVALGELTGKLGEGIRQKSTMLALSLIILGGVVSVFHLAHPGRVFYLVSNLNSAFGRELIMSGLMIILMILYLLALRKNYTPSLRNIIAILGLISSVLFTYIVGFTYVLPGRPAWNSHLLPLVYVFSAAALGIFVIYAMAANEKSEGNAVLLKNINGIALAILVLEAIVVFGYYSFLASSAYLSETILAANSISILFGLGVVVAGLFIPFGLSLWARIRNINIFSVALISLTCTVIGGIAFRAMMYIIGVNFPLSL